MIKCGDKCKYNRSNQHKNISSCYKKTTNKGKKNISGKKTYLEHGITSKINLSKLGEDLIKSAYELENALSKLIDAEARKVTAIMKKYYKSKCKSNLTANDDILLLNDQLKNSLYLIKEIEEIIKVKIVIGLYLVEGMDNISYEFQDLLNMLDESELNHK